MTENAFLDEQTELCAFAVRRLRPYLGQFLLHQLDQTPRKQMRRTMKVATMLVLMECLLEWTRSDLRQQVDFCVCASVWVCVAVSFFLCL